MDRRSDAAAMLEAAPRGLERWTRINAGASLAGLAGSVAFSDLRPSIAVSISSIVWCWLRYAPRSTERTDLANLLTAGRLAALAGALALVPHAHGAIASCAGLVYALDGLDGWVARRRGEASAFGAQFDMETDAHVILLLSAYLTVVADFGPWVLGFGALRFVYVLARAACGTAEHRGRERRSNLGRWVYTFVSLSLAVACVPAWAPWTLPLLAAALAALVLSFLPDFAALARNARHSTIA